MEVIGIICEYNPFHNGHLFHINKIKEMYPESIIVLVLSGYFTERADVSILSKYDKVSVALTYGVDLVIELPTLYTLNSADYFADASIKLLNYAHVNKIVFGSECDDISLLKKIALDEINNTNVEMIKTYLKEGYNYPTSLSKTYDAHLMPNDILGLSYVKAILKNHYDIEPITIKRTNDYKDIHSNEEIISADNIRNKIKDNIDVSKYIPKYDETFKYVQYDKLFTLLKFKIITESDLSIYLGVDEGLENKIKKEIVDASNLEELILKLKSKRYTYVRIKRMLIHILLGIKKTDMNESIDFARVLGFTEAGKRYLKELNSEKLVFKYDTRVREIELQTSYIYDELTHDLSIEKEILNKPIIK